jgi:hypothetical protein
MMRQCSINAFGIFPQVCRSMAYSAEYALGSRSRSTGKPETEDHQLLITRNVLIEPRLGTKLEIRTDKTPMPLGTIFG